MWFSVDDLLENVSLFACIAKKKSRSEDFFLSDQFINVNFAVEKNTARKKNVNCNKQID